MSAVRIPNFARIDLFSFTAGSDSPTLLRGGQFSLTPALIAEIERLGLNSVLVRKSDLNKVSISTLAGLDKILKDNRLTIAERFALLQIAVWDELEHNSRRLHSEQFIEVAQQAGQRIAHLLFDSPVLASELFTHALRDESSAVHLTNVAAYSVLLAQEMGVREQKELSKIAIGAMLHEFGKLFLSIDLLNKTGRLTIQEREAHGTCAAHRLRKALWSARFGLRSAHDGLSTT